jgi:hypothetical protein
MIFTNATIISMNAQRRPGTHPNLVNSPTALDQTQGSAHSTHPPLRDQFCMFDYVVGTLGTTGQ